jgi:hypothetical protein
MGASLVVGPAGDGKEGFDVPELGERAAASDDGVISSEFRQQMHDAISDAHAISSRPMQVVMPWEEPSMAWIFGDRDPLDFPVVAPVWVYVEPQSDAADTRTGGELAISDKPTGLCDRIQLLQNMPPE